MDGRTDVRATYERSDDENVEGVHIRDDAGHTISVVRALRFDGRDQASRMDRYALVQSGGATVYGGIDMWLVDDSDHGWIYLSPEAEELLDADCDAYEIDLPPGEFRLVDETLTRFLRLDGGDVARSE